MPNYELEATGTQSSSHKELVQRISSQFMKKEEIFKKRAEQLETITQIMNTLLPIGAETQQLYSAKSVREVDDYFFSSAILHQGWNFVQNSKLYPDHVDFDPEITLPPEKRAILARNTSSIHSFARRKGSYHEATKNAHADLVRGESWLYRDYEVDEEGTNVKLMWSHIPWQNVRQAYGDTDELILSEYTLDKYAEKYGKAMLKKVQTGGFIGSYDKREDINFDRLQVEQRLSEKILVVTYIDKGQKVFAEVHGGGAYVHKLLKGDKYPFVDTDGTAFSPLRKRVFYEPFVGYHGWGVLDMLLPVARLDTTIVNASANRAVLAADPLTVMATNEPEEARKMYRQHKRNRRNGQTDPFFVFDSNTGTKIDVQNIDQGTNDSNFNNWQEYLISQATMRTGIDFRVLTEFAPTAEQQKLRKLEQDKMNVGVLTRNKYLDSRFAQEDIYFLQNTTSKFHNITVWLERHQDEFSHMSEQQVNELRDNDGKLPLREAAISEYLDEVGETEFNITPRLDGVFDDQTFLEVASKKEDLALLSPDSKAYRKLAVDYFRAVHPSSNIRDEDLMPPQPQIEQQAPSPEQAAPVVTPV